MPPIGPRNQAQNRARRALQLRTMCRTWQEIADAEGFKSPGAAHNAVDRLLKKQPPENLAAMRIYTTEGMRLIQSTLFEALSDAKRRHDTSAVVAVSRAIVEVMDKHARLVGMHIAVPQEVNVRVEQSAAAVVERAEAELLALAASSPSPGAGLPVLDAEVVEP